jgi:hypothetical protein
MHITTILIRVVLHHPAKGQANRRVDLLRAGFLNRKGKRNCNKLIQDRGYLAVGRPVGAQVKEKDFAERGRGQ